MNQFLASRNIPRHIQANWFALFVKADFVIALWVGSMWLAASPGCWPQIISMCLIMRCTPNSPLVDRVDFATPLSLSSRSVTSLSALAPAQRAGAQRLCAVDTKLPIRNVRFHGRCWTRTGRAADIAKPTFMTQCGQWLGMAFVSNPRARSYGRRDGGDQNGDGRRAPRPCSGRPASRLHSSQTSPVDA